MRRLGYLTTTFVAAIVLMLGTSFTAWAAELMTLTFVRHGESQANFDGVIDTSVPGPHLTADGQAQAVAIGQALMNNGYDGIYASTMIRTVETAQPLATALGMPIQVLPGVHEISAGIFEGSSEDEGLGRIGYVIGPVAWTLGARFVPVLGASDGNAFDERVDKSIETIYYTNGDRNAVVFSHGATIMFWTMMNVDNPDLGLLLSHQLDNTDVVVIEGNPEDGWILKSWDGIEVSAEPSLPTKLFVTVRNLVTAPQTALYRIQQALVSFDVADLLAAVRDGVVNVVQQVVGFVPRLVNDVVGSLGGDSQLLQQSVQEAPEETADITASRLESDVERKQVAQVSDNDKVDEQVVTEKLDQKLDQKIDAPKVDTKIDDEKPAVTAKLTDGNKFEPGDTLVSNNTVVSKLDEDKSVVEDSDTKVETPAATVTAVNPEATSEENPTQTAAAGTGADTQAAA